MTSQDHSRPAPQHLVADASRRLRSVTSFSQRVVRSFLWQGGAQAAGQVISWLSTIVVIRFLSPADYGLMAMASVFFGFFLLFADLGFGTAAVQATTLDPLELRRMLGIVWLTHFGGFAFMLLGAPVVAAFFGEPRVVPVIRVLSVSFLLVAAYVLPQAQLLREMDFKSKARIDVNATVASALIALALAAAGYGVWALVAGAMVLHGLRAVAYNATRPLRLFPKFSLQASSRLSRFGAIVTVDRLLFFLYGQLDVVIAGRLLGKEAIGVYMVALSLAAIPIERVLPVINQVSFAAFSRIQADPERVRRNMLRAVQLVGLVCFPALFGMAAIAGDLVPVVLGSKWLQVIVPFQLLCLILPLKAVNALFAPALFAVGRPGVKASNTAVALIIMAAAIFLGVRGGVIGLCLAWVIAYPAVFAVTSWRSVQALRVPYDALLERCVFPIAASIAMAGIVIALRVVLSPFNASALRLGVLTACGVLVYGGLVLLLNRGEVVELVSLVRG